MTLEQLYNYLGSYVRNGYGHLNVGVENSFSEGGDLNSIILSNDGHTLILKESYGPPFIVFGLYDVDAGKPFIAKQATGCEGPGVHAGDYILERDDGNKIMHTICGIPKTARFSGIVAHFGVCMNQEILDDKLTTE